MAGKPETFVVQQVLKREEWPGDKGQMVTYELLFADDREVFKAHVPAEKDPGLEDGKEVEGWKNPGGKFGIATGSSNGSKRSQGGSSDNFDRRPDHPQTQERMRHTTALSAAPAYYQLLREEGVQDKPADKAEMLNTLSGLILWLEGTYPVPEA